MEDLEAALGKALGGELEGRIEGKFAEFGGLLTREAAVLLLARENGIPIDKEIPLSEAPKTALPFSFTAKVERIFPMQVYPNGVDRSVRIHLSDKSGEGTLLLWNDQCACVEGEVFWGDTVEGRGAFFRGGEISIGKAGSLRVASSHPIAQVSELTAGVCSVKGQIGEIEDEVAYKDKKTGEEKRIAAFQLCQGQSCRRVVVWQKPEGFSPSAGDNVVLENVVFRNGEVHFNSYSRMVKKGSVFASYAKLEAMRFGEGMATFALDGKLFAISLQEALSLLGVKSIPEGVSAQTLLCVKSSQLEGRRVQYTLQDGKLCRLAAAKEGQ